MNTYEYTLKLKVRVEAYSEEDGEDAIHDIFGVGTDCGADVIELKVESVDVT